MAPKLSPNPGRTARFYRKNRRSRLKHRRDELERGKTQAKRQYRSQLKIAREQADPSPQEDMSHRNGKLVPESRKTNRARGGSQKR